MCHPSCKYYNSGISERDLKGPQYVDAGIYKQSSVTPSLQTWPINNTEVTNVNQTRASVDTGHGGGRHNETEEAEILVKDSPGPVSLDPTVPSTPTRAARAGEEGEGHLIVFASPWIMSNVKGNSTPYCFLVTGIASPVQILLFSTEMCFNRFSPRSELGPVKAIRCGAPVGCGSFHSSVTVPLTGPLK
ncbi:hypothetical protein J6590_046732 [Homalodisca vitripennis]|nr:hypothetical protein J6590_046732 [Homalodisca vitripennis]